MVAGAGLGLGIAGTALALLKGDWNNAVPGILNGNGGGANGLMARAQVGYDFAIAEKVNRLSEQMAGVTVAISKDAEIAALKDQNMEYKILRYVDDKTCGMVKGNNFISPRQMADPYMGSPMVISTHKPVVEVERHRECGCDGRDWDKWY